MIVAPAQAVMFSAYHHSASRRYHEVFYHRSTLFPITLALTDSVCPCECVIMK